MESRNEEATGNESLPAEVMESMGVSKEVETPAEEAAESSGHVNENDPLFVQKRLKRVNRAHQREIGELRSKIDELNSRLNANSSHYVPDHGLGTAPQGVDEQIHKAVAYALHHKEMEEAKAREAEHQAHINRQYAELHQHLDHMADKYDDFDDIVRGSHVPFTESMKNASIFLPKSGPGSAGEVLYKLGKNRTELERIAKLHPTDQASEMVKLSHALVNGGEANKTQPRASHNPMGNIKSNPVTNSLGVTEKTPVSELRKRMKAGWK